MPSSFRFDRTYPPSFLSGRIPNIPPSKSIAQRAFICAALANGTTTFLSHPSGEDCDLLLNALQRLGIPIQIHEKGITITGGREHLIASSQPVIMGNNGTGVRFLLALSLLVSGTIIIDGSERLRERPMKEMFDVFSQLGVSFHSTYDGLPVTISGNDFKGGMIELDTSRSSQFLSALLLVAPYAKNGLRIHCNGNIVSNGYIDITIDVMKQFGVTVEQSGNSYIIPPQEYKPQTFTIEPDASSTSYFFAGAAITKNRVTINNIHQNSRQPDFTFLHILEKMNCSVQKTSDSVTILGKDLKGITIDCNTCPDIVPTLAVVAAFANGKTEITNVAHLRHKESDRIAILTRELQKIGVDVIEHSDGLTIIPQPVHPSVINPESDHRIAMSFAVAGLRIPGLEILQPECVQKSFPDFWREFLE